MKNFYVFLIAVLFSGFGFGQTTIYTQDFETVDDGYTASSTEGSTFIDVFNRVNPNIGGNSSFIWAIEDTNVTPATITLDQIDVTGYTDFTLSIDMLAHHYNDWDNSDTFSITYSLDNGATQNLLWVRNAGGTFNQAASLDTDFDGVGDCGSGILPALTTGTSGCTVTSNTFATFSSSTITLSSNTTLDIVLTFENMTAADEGMYLDNIIVEANGVGASAPTGVVTGTVGSITANSAIISSNSVGGDGGSPITERGVAYSTSPSPTTADDTQIVAGTTGSFNATLSGLNSITLYYARAYATNAEGTTYGSEIDFTTNAPAGDTDSDIIANTGFSYTNDIPYISYVTNGPLTTANSIEVGQFTIRDGGAGTDVDDFDTTLTSLTLALDNSANLSRIALFDGTSNIAEQAATISVGFIGLNLIAGDDTDKTFSVRVSFNSTVTDNQQLSFTITAAAAQAGASLFAAADAGGASTSTAGDDNRIEVIATDLIFDQDATDAQVDNPMSPAPTLWAVDTNVNIDLDYITNVSIASTGTLTGTTTVVPLNGVATFTDLTHTAEGTGLFLTASSGTLTDDDSSPFDVTDVVIFEKINALAELTDGEYIILNKTEAFAMNSAHTGSLFPETAVTPVADQLEDPIDAIIWIISTDGSSRTIQSKNTNEYASYTGGSNNIQSVASVTTDNQRWDFAFSTDEFVVTNAAVTGRTLRYNSSAPRFVCYGSSFGENLILYKKAGGPVIYTFNGTWSPSNPNGTATASDDIVIATGNASIDANTTCNTLTVNPGASLTIDTGVTLTTADATNGLTLESSSDSYSSLINNGTIVGTINYERFVNGLGSGLPGTGGNDLIAAPVGTDALIDFNDLLLFGNNSTVIASSGTLYAFAPFNNTTGNYDVEDTALPSPVTIVAGQGYRMATTSGNTVTFSGPFSSGTVPIAISTGAVSQWNLIGNPYPSYINSLEFLSANTGVLDPAAAAIYAYNAGTYFGLGESIGNFTIINNITNSDLNMAPGQGFFVASSATGGNVNFTPTMRTTTGADDFIVGRSSNMMENYKLVLGLQSSSNASTSFYFNENSSRGLDVGYDAAVFGENANNAPIYSHLVEDNMGRAMAMQSLGASDFEDIVVPLGVNSNQGNQVRFSIDQSTLPSTINVYLEDQVTNTMTLLNTGDYVFTPNTDLSGTGRFFLSFSNSTLSDIDNSFDALSIYTDQARKTIVVSGQLLEPTVANVYDLQGRLVIKTQLEPSRTTQSIAVSNLSAGAYVIQLTDASKSKSQKIILR